MRKLFNPDSPLILFLDGLCDIVVLNFFALLCSVPLITFGASMCGLYTALREKKQGHGAIYRSFFIGLKRCFYRATFAHLLMSGAMGYIVFCYMFRKAAILLLLLSLVGMLFLLFGTWFYPLLVYTDEPVRALIRRTLMCCIGYLPRSFAMVAVYLLPAIMFFFAADIFVRYFCWILTFWLALSACIGTIIIQKPLRTMGLAQEDL